jgi:type II secretory pathway pseudopilin PulG
MRAGRPANGSSERGFTYVWVMTAVAILGVGLAAVGPLWSDAVKREREQELLRIGQIYAQAIGSYYRSSPGSQKRYPPSLEALLLDTRFVGTYRHLRRLYTDPLKPSQAWSVIRAADGGVLGVFSQSVDAPLRREPLDLGITVLPAASKYSDWQFVPKVD